MIQPKGTAMIASDVATERPPAPAKSDLHLLPLIVLAALAGVGDVLLLHSAAGISVSLFALALFAGSAVANARALRPLAIALALIVLAVALAPSVENFSFVSLLFALLGTALAARIAAGRIAGPGFREAAATLWVAVAGPLQAFLDAATAAERRPDGIAPRLSAPSLLAWCAPIVFGALFLTIFAVANPVFDLWTRAVGDVLGDIDEGRVGAWVVIALACWSFVVLRPFPAMRFAAKAATQAACEPRPSGGVFGRAAILRSLIVFNVVFAMQTVMDLAYLWGRAELPDGVTYAAYAHRGAGALLVAALISAGFMLATMRPGSVMERSRLIRALALFWTAQNVLLVVSAMLRIGLYVEVYSLTYLRVAAMIWMALVAIGLALIVARIVFRRSLGWLVWSNAISLGATLYACCFVNFADLIARHNIAHSVEMGGPGQLLDQRYLCALGPDALPAIRDYVEALDTPPPATAWRDASLARFCADEMQAAFDAKVNDWRSWTLRDARLRRQLSDGPDSAA